MKKNKKYYALLAVLAIAALFSVSLAWAEKTSTAEKSVSVKKPTRNLEIDEKKPVRNLEIKDEAKRNLTIKKEPVKVEPKVTITPSKEVSEKVIKENVPVKKVEIVSNNVVRRECFEEIGESGIYSYCNGDEEEKEVTKTINNTVEENTDDDNVNKEETAPLPQSGSNTYIITILGIIFTAGLLFIKRRGFRTLRYETLFSH